MVLDEFINNFDTRLRTGLDRISWFKFLAKYLLFKGIDFYPYKFATYYPRFYFRILGVITFFHRKANRFIQHSNSDALHHYS